MKRIAEWVYRKRDAKIASLCDEISALKLENENLHDSIILIRQEKDSCNDRCLRLNTVLEHAQEDHKLATDRCQTLQTLLADAKEHNQLSKASLAEEINCLKTEIEAKTKTLLANDSVHTDMQKQINTALKDCKELRTANNTLYKQIDKMGLCIMNKKDVYGRVFTRMAPLLDDEGHKLLRENSGRMKVQLIRSDGVKSIAYIEMDNG